MLKTEIEMLKKTIADVRLKIKTRISAGVALLRAEYELCKVRLKEAKTKIVSYFKSWSN